MANLDIPLDEKYVVFKLDDMQRFIDGERILSAFGVQQVRLKDAVVIRRQDLFASPCLATYAAMIGLVASREADPKVKANLLDIADYFERQAELAAEEGFKLPDV